MKKKYGSGITEKRLNDRRFRRTEEAILRVFFEENIFVGVKEIAEKVGVARSTFYHHHRTVREIVPDYKKYILRKYAVLVNRLTRRKYVTVRKIYGETLFFMIHNRKIFEFLVKSGEIGTIKEMVMRLKPKLMRQMRLSYNGDKIFGVYGSEVAELIYNWVRGGFDEDEIGVLLNDVMFLTDTVKARLKGIA